MIRILVTGSRFATAVAHREYVWNRLTWWANYFGGEHIIMHGQCHFGGVDLLAEEWAAARGWKTDRHPASRYGGALKRNRAMVALGPRVCIGFPSTTRSTGTIHCLTEALKAGVEVHAYPIDTAVAR